MVISVEPDLGAHDSNLPGFYQEKRYLSWDAINAASLSSETW